MYLRGRRKLYFLLVVAALLGNVSHVYAADILFMHSPANLDFDEALAEYMEGLGHTVTFFDTTGIDPEDHIDEAMNADLVYIAESLGSTSTHDGSETFIKEVTTPQIWAEAYAWDEAAITGDIQFEDFGNTQRANIDEDPVEEFNEGQTGFFIQNASHPLAGGFSGMVEVYEDEYSLNWGLSSTLGPGAEVIASVDEEGTYATLFAYPAGAELEDGTESAGVRIGMWIGQAGNGPPLFDNITEDGLSMISAAIEWSLNPVVGPPGDFDGNGELDAADIDLLTAAVDSGDTAATFDVNGDGNVDRDDRLTWINELQGSFVGDSNFDGEFSSGDFVVVFTAGKYETGNAANYAEGDWNGDGLFDSGDFVAAFTAGGYEMGPRAATAAVPEPSSLVILLMGLSLTFRRKR